MKLFEREALKGNCLLNLSFVSKNDTVWAEKGYGPCLIGEVSMVNDDTNDNRFYEPQGRFPTIEEDEPPLYLLCHEYPAARD